jgi:hypothetical protein
VAETNRSIEDEAKQFIADNELLLDSGFGSTEAGTLATSEILGRIVVHGGEIANKLSAEVVYEMDERVRATNAVTDAIKDPRSTPKSIKELEDERTRVAISQEASTKQATFEQLSSLLERAIELRRGSSYSSTEEAMERVYVPEVPESPEVADVPNIPDVPQVSTQQNMPGTSLPAVDTQPKRSILKRLFGGR